MQGSCTSRCLAYAAASLVFILFSPSASAFIAPAKLLVNLGQNRNRNQVFSFGISSPKNRACRPAFAQWKAATSVRIASYNVLSSALSEPDYYSSLDPEHLDPANRLRGVLAQLVSTASVYTTRPCPASAPFAPNFVQDAVPFAKSHSLSSFICTENCMFSSIGAS